MAAKKRATTKRDAYPELSIVRDILSLVDVEVSVAFLRKHTTEEVLAAEHWAASEHLRASDNRVRKEPKPAWLPPSGTEKRLAKRR